MGLDVKTIQRETVEIGLIDRLNSVFLDELNSITTTLQKSLPNIIRSIKKNTKTNGVHKGLD